MQVLGDLCDAIHEALRTFTSVGGRCCRGVRAEGQQSDRDDDDHLSHGSPFRVLELDHMGQVKPGGHTQTQPTPSTSMQ